MQKRILHLEDDENDVFFFKTCLKKTGFTGVYRNVRGGVEGIEYLTGEGIYWDRDLHPSPDLIVCDLKMPGMDGFDFIRWVRNHHAFAQISLFTLSSSAMEKDKLAALKAGADDYLVKPDSLVGWESMVQRILGIQHAPVPSLGHCPHTGVS